MTNKLWQCPLKIERGTYSDMPESWLGASVNYYVGAENHQEALKKQFMYFSQWGWCLLIYIMLKSCGSIQPNGGMDTSWLTSRNIQATSLPKKKFLILLKKVEFFMVLSLVGKMNRIIHNQLINPAKKVRIINFRIVRELTPFDFNEHQVWSEYDGEELEELRALGIDEVYIRELLAIAEDGTSHPFYPVPESETIPDRMRIHIHCKFFSPSGREFQGVIVNPTPFVIGVFCNNEIMYFNPNLMDYWKKSEERLRSFYKLGEEDIFPLKYNTNLKDSKGKLVTGVYGE